MSGLMPSIIGIPPGTIITARHEELIAIEAHAEQIGVDHTGGYFSNSIGPLSTLGLIVRSRGEVSPTDLLFPEGLR